MCGRDPVVSALYSLFAAFVAEEQQLQLGGPLQGSAARRGLVNPSELRQALSALPGPQQYRVGECWGGVLGVRRQRWGRVAGRRSTWHAVLQLC